MSWLSQAVFNDHWTGSVLAQVTLVAVTSLVMASWLKPGTRHTLLHGALWALLLCPIAVAASRTVGFFVEIPMVRAEQVYGRALAPHVGAELHSGASQDVVHWLPVESSDSTLEVEEGPGGSSSEGKLSPEPARSGRGEPETSRFIIDVFRPWTRAVGAVWLVGLLVGVGRILSGVWWVRSLVKASTPICLGTLPIRQRLRDVFGDEVMLPEILESKQLNVPIVTGHWRSIVIFPRGLSQQLSADELVAMLVHECAHGRRRDCLVGTVQRIVGAVYWFHPAVHWLNRRLDIVREEICDNFVLLTTDPAAYSRFLLRLSEQATPPSAAVMPLLSRSWKLEDRVKGLLDPKRDMRTRSSRWNQVVTVVSLGLAIALLSSVRMVATGEEQGVAGSHETTAFDVYGDVIPYKARVRAGTERFRPVGDGWHRSITFTGDGSKVVVLTRDGCVSWWNAHTGEQTGRLRLGVTTRAFAVAPDKSTFAFCYFRFIEEEARYEQGLQIRKLATGELMVNIPLEGHQDDTKLQYTPDGRQIIHAGRQAKVRIFDLTLQEEMLEYQLPEERSIDQIAISPDGDQIVLACARKLFLWNWLEGSEPEVLEDFPRVTCLSFSPDGQSLAIAFDSGGKDAVEILDLPTRKITKTFRDDVMKHLRATNVAFSSDGQRLIVPNQINLGAGSRDNSVVVWQVQTGELIQRLRSDNAAPGMVAVSPNDQLVATAGEHEIAVWRLGDGKRMAAELGGHTARITAVRFAHSDTRLVTSSDDATTRVWDSLTGKPVGRMNVVKWIRAMDVSSDGKWIATSSLDDTVTLWDALTLKKVYTVPGHGKYGGTRDVAFSPDSTTFHSFGDDGFLRTWDVANGESRLTTELKPNGQSIAGDNEFERFRGVGIFSPDASKLIVMIRHQAAYLFETSTGKELKSIPTPRPIESACFSGDGNALLFTRPTVDPKRTPLKDGRIRFSAADQFEAVLMDLKDDSEIWSFPIESHFGSIGLSPDGRWAALCRRHELGDSIHIVNALDGHQVAKINGVEKLGWDASDKGLCFSADGRRLAVALENTSVLVWDLADLGVKK